MKQTDQHALDEFREQCRRQMDRPLALRVRYGFYRTYKPVLDDAPWRACIASARVRETSDLPTAWHPENCVGEPPL